MPDPNATPEEIARYKPAKPKRPEDYPFEEELDEEQRQRDFEFRMEDARDGNW